MSDMNVENHMVLNTADAPWNQPDADEPTVEEINLARDREQRAQLAAEYADGLRQLADFIEEHPNAPRPLGTFYAFLYDRESFLAGVVELAKGGKVTKRMDEREEGFYNAERQFGPITLQVSIPRKTICRLVSPAVYDCPDSLLEAAAEYAEA